MSLAESPVKVFDSKFAFIAIKYAFDAVHFVYQTQFKKTGRHAVVCIQNNQPICWNIVEYFEET